VCERNIFSSMSAYDLSETTIVYRCRVTNRVALSGRRECGEEQINKNSLYSSLDVLRAQKKVENRRDWDTAGNTKDNGRLTRERSEQVKR
jgi:hypothetical protein